MNLWIRLQRLTLSSNGEFGISGVKFSGSNSSQIVVSTVVTKNDLTIQIFRAPVQSPCNKLPVFEKYFNPRIQ